jgi:hypothetical protein
MGSVDGIDTLNQEKCNYRPSGRNRTYGHRITYTEGRLLRFSYDFPMILA